MMETYWQDLGGRIECAKHIGMEASARLSKRPTAKTLTTSMTKWFRMTEPEIVEFAKYINATVTICESCRYRAK
jgi:hypothetical protein